MDNLGRDIQNAMYVLAGLGFVVGLCIGAAVVYWLTR
jgi:ABC-type branched-subunit amino acid transport system permease subunit